jgi:hypothetical protein
MVLAGRRASRVLVRRVSVPGATLRNISDIQWGRIIKLLLDVGNEWGELRES